MPPTFKNPWGQKQGLDVQRADLWTVDLVHVCTHLSQLGSADSLPGNNDTIFYANAVSLPELKVNTQVYYRDTIPFNMPGFDDPVGPVRITFNLDTPTGGSSSKIYALLEQWRSLVRTGRGNFADENEPKSLNGTAINGVKYSPVFRFDIPLRYYRGVSELDQISLNDDQDSSGTLIPSSIYNIKNGWLSSIQLSELSYSSGSTPATVTAQIYPEIIYTQQYE